MITHAIEMWPGSPPERKRLMEEWAKANKLRHVGGKVCWRRLHGKRCRGSGCDCMPYTLNCPLVDHSSVWRKADGSYLILLQPYLMSLDTIRALGEFCVVHGLNVTVTTYPSYHSPGLVLSIVLTRNLYVD